jgi:integrase
MATPLLDNNELTLLRYWLNGLPVESLVDFCGDDKPAAVLSVLRSRLILKARRLEMAWGDGWLERKAKPDWLALTLKRVESLQKAEDIAPNLDEPLTFWLSDDWLEKLQPAGLMSVSDWFELYQSDKDWWQDIAGLGRVSAKAIEAEFGRLFPEALAESSATPPPIIYQSGLAPLENFLLPEAFDGSQGVNRSPDTPFIPAADDYDALICWLSRFEPDSHTYRSYKREAERLLLWAILVKQKALSSLNLVDMGEYRRFLADPQPYGIWVGPPQKKGSKEWKPFTGPLSPRSRRFSETVLSGLFNFLLAQRYLLHNPMKALPKLKNPDSLKPLDTNRSFNAEQWRLIEGFLDSQVETSEGFERLKWVRLRLVAQLGYGTGLRLHELAQATVGDILLKQRQGKNQYWLVVLGKGQKLREVPLPFRLYCLLVESYQALTGRQLNRPSQDCPLIPPLRGPETKALTPSALHKQLKQAFASAADSLPEGQEETKTKLIKASAHWLRHTHGSAAVDKQIPLTMIRDNLGHSSIATTSHYVHADQDARHEAFTEGFSELHDSVQ